MIILKATRSFEIYYAENEEEASNHNLPRIDVRAARRALERLGYRVTTVRDEPPVRVEALECRACGFVVGAGPHNPRRCPRCEALFGRSLPADVAP